MKELVVISGKGGTGKTSILAAFAALARDKVLADCDVDAADLHLLLAPTVRRREEFSAGFEAVIRQADCLACGACLARCRFDAVRREGGGAGEAIFTIDPFACEGCGVCAEACPLKAIDMRPRVSGEWFVSDTRCGPMVHARLGVGEENSGKLVSTVRREAAREAVARGFELVLTDGPPGVGCPVIASIGGASLVLMVTEPTVSGRHDLERVADLARHFRTPAAVCINKTDINPAVAADIARWCDERKLPLLATLPYDEAVTRAQLAARSIVEVDDGPVSRAVRDLWRQVAAKLEISSD